jgi:hypothetical protein
MFVLRRLLLWKCFRYSAKNGSLVCFNPETIIACCGYHINKQRAPLPHPTLHTSRLAGELWHIRCNTWTTTICYLFVRCLMTLFVIQTEWTVDSALEIMLKEGQGCGRKQSWHNLMYYLCICMDGLRKIDGNLCRNSRCPGGDPNRVHPEYKSEPWAYEPYS